jgi:hypothetical protein
MNDISFKQSLTAELPPAILNVYMQALWFDARDNWNAAHNLIDHLNDATACRIHAYLHRKEGDLSNAAYWYRRASIAMPAISLQQEWDDLVNQLLTENNFK